MPSIITPRYSTSPVSKPKSIKSIPYAIKNGSSLVEFPILTFFKNIKSLNIDNSFDNLKKPKYQLIKNSPLFISFFKKRKISLFNTFNMYIIINKTLEFIHLVL
ncbi:hypothetical protein ACTFIZ_010157 [Dictyostelium cf. discoideum]